MKFIKVFIVFSFIINLFCFSFACDQQEVNEIFRNFQNGRLEDFFDQSGKVNNEFLDKLIAGYGLEPDKINRYLFLQTLAKYFDDYKANKEGKYEELFSQLTSTFAKLVYEAELLGSKKIEEKDTRIFKKRHLAALLGLLAFLGINIRIYFKWFNWNKENEQKIADLEGESEKNKAICLAEHEKLIEQLSEKLEQKEKDQEKVFEQQSEKLKEEISDLDRSIGQRIDACKKRTEKLNKKIDAVSNEKIERMAGKSKKDIVMLQRRITVMCDEKIEKVRKEIEQIHEGYQRGIEACKKEVDESKQEMQKFQRGVVDILDKNQKEMKQTKEGIGKIGEAIEQCCKEAEKGGQQAPEEESFWRSLFTVDFDASEAIKGLEKMITLTNGVEKVAKMFAGEDKISEGQLRERLDHLHLNLPSVPRFEPGVRV